MWVADELEYEVGCSVADCGDGEHDEAVGVDGQIDELPVMRSPSMRVLFSVQ